ncbi:MAG: hypothetical protein ACRDH9_09250 [Actinomycetota bacterium]
MSDVRRWRKRRWRQDPRCAYCRVVTVLRWADPRKPAPLNLATVDHLRDRYDPTRHEPANGEVRRVLACWKCNHDRERARTAALSKKELWRRSGHYDRMIAKEQAAHG